LWKTHTDNTSHHSTNITFLFVRRSFALNSTKNRFETKTKFEQKSACLKECLAARLSTSSSAGERAERGGGLRKMRKTST